MMENKKLNNDNIHNINLDNVRKRDAFKQIEEEKASFDFILEEDELFNREKYKELDCHVYLYEEIQECQEPKKPRSVLVFHFKHLFDLTIEGVAINGKMMSMERLGLPSGLGNYKRLTPTFIKCKPVNVINKGSKGNKLNNTAILNPRDWIYQSLASLGLDKLVQTIYKTEWEFTEPPTMEPPDTLCDVMANKAAEFCSYVSESVGGAYSKPVLQYNQSKQNSKNKITTEIPQLKVPHVPSEYDTKKRNAVVIRYNSNNNWAILFHFEGDDAFRTIEGVWHENTLKPSFKKARPEGNHGYFNELGTIQFSPEDVRKLALDNPYNGANTKSGVSEMDWAREICTRLGLNWNNDQKWTYHRPPQYTVAPDRTILTFPKIPSSSRS